jgi:glycine/D-amino acid oxidase-like deaminating enzyme
LARATPWDCGFRARESLYGASRLQDVPALRAEYELRRRHGFDVRFWNRARLEREGSLPFHAAIISRPSAQMDAHCFAHGLLRRALRRWCPGIRSHHRHSLGAAGRGVALRTDRGAVVQARRVVIAVGLRCRMLACASRCTKLQTTFAVISEPGGRFPGWPGRDCVWETARTVFSMRARRTDNRVLFGGRGRAVHQPATPLRGAARQRARCCCCGVSPYFPEIAVEPAYAWAGLLPRTEDGLPFIGRIPGHSHGRSSRSGRRATASAFSFVAAGIIRDLCLGRPIAMRGSFGSDAPDFRSDWASESTSLEILKTENLEIRKLENVGLA